MKYLPKIFILVFLGLVLIPWFFVKATDFSSNNYMIKDPVLKIGGGFATSSNFQMWGAFGQEAIGTSTANSFNLYSGFLYYSSKPNAASGLSASAVSQTQINLSWIDNSNNETGFKIERKTGAGGIYSQIATTSQNSIDYPDTGLGAGTVYYYQVRAFNSAGDSNYSNEAGATTQSPPSQPPSQQGGGGGGGFIPTPTIQTSAVFRGKAYPLSDVTLLQDGRVVSITKAGPDANFEIAITNLTGGTYSFGIWSEDSKGLRSTTQTFTISLTTGVPNTISGIFLSPTISIDKIQVKQGDVLNFLGQSVPQAKVSLVINSDEEIVKNIPTDKFGIWLYKFDTLGIEKGDHSGKSRAAFQEDISPFSQLVFFKIGNENVAAPSIKKCPSKGDLNNDCRVNLIDFSIAAYWYKRSLSPGFSQIEKTKLNGDGKVDLVDFSIMAYYWTG